MVFVAPHFLWLDENFSTAKQSFDRLKFIEGEWAVACFFIFCHDTNCYDRCQRSVVCPFVGKIRPTQKLITLSEGSEWLLDMNVIRLL